MNNLTHKNHWYKQSCQTRVSLHLADGIFMFGSTQFQVNNEIMRPTHTFNVCACRYRACGAIPFLLSYLVCLISSFHLDWLCLDAIQGYQTQNTKAFESGRLLQLTVMRQHTESHHTLWHIVADAERTNRKKNGGDLETNAELGYILSNYTVLDGLNSFILFKCPKQGNSIKSYFKNSAHSWS